MKATNIRKLQQAIKALDKAYDLIREVYDNEYDQEHDSTAYRLEDISVEVSNQTYYINDIISAQR